MIKSPAIKTKDGKIFLGRNHAEILQSQPIGYFKNNQEQGFITIDGVFLNRQEAFTIAEENNQIIIKHGNPNELYSEDLYKEKKIINRVLDFKSHLEK